MDQRAQQLFAITAAVVASIQECPGGPASSIFMALQAHFPRLTMAQFTGLMRVVEATGLVQRHGQQYFPVQEQHAAQR